MDISNVAFLICLKGMSMEFSLHNQPGRTLCADETSDLCCPCAFYPVLFVYVLVGLSKIPPKAIKNSSRTKLYNSEKLNIHDN